MSETLRVLDTRFRNCCKVLFREEVGGVLEFDSYLSGLIEKNRSEESFVSGKAVELGIKEYAKGSRFISFDEVDFKKKYEPVSLDSVDGMDSLVSVFGDRLAYCGNVVLGNSKYVEKSANISDSFYVYGSALYGDSKYLYNCTVGRLSSDLFGVHAPGESQMCMRCTQTYKTIRCFEAWACQNCMDCYYSFSLQNCNDCIFCFNLKNKKNCVGNVQLSAEKYKEVKARLLSGMANGLKRDKKLPSLMEIIFKCAKVKPGVPAQKEVDLGGGKDAVESAFSKTAKIVLGVELKGIDNYKEWLLEHTHRMEEARSAASGKHILSIPYVIALPPMDEGRMVTFAEAQWLGENASIGKEAAEGVSLSNVHESLGKIAFYPVEIYEGKNNNITDCSLTIDCSYCYNSSAQVYSKYCACGMWPRSSEHVFGFDTLWDCSFCIKCYHGVKLQRCFEVDQSSGSSDCYFCHNIENCHDCILCFNVKNLKYAIGNAVYPKEEYLRIKKLVLAEVVGKLEGSGKFDLSIYDLGAL